MEGVEDLETDSSLTVGAAAAVGAAALVPEVDTFGVAGGAEAATFGTPFDPFFLPGVPAGCSKTNEDKNRQKHMLQELGLGEGEAYPPVSGGRIHTLKRTVSNYQFLKHQKDIYHCWV